MFKYLLQFEVYYQIKQRAFPIFSIMFLCLGLFIGKQGFAPNGVNFNSVYQVYFYTSLFTLGSVFIIMFFAISAILRDREHQMEAIIFSSSIKKKQYFWSRFLGTFIFSVLAFTPFIAGYLIGVQFFSSDPERLSAFNLATYLQPWFYIVLPNIFISSTIIFSVSTLTKNSTATYVSAVFIYMLYFISSIFLNSPLIAQAVPASPESMAMAALADPFGIAAFFEQTQFWTTYQKNTQLLSFSGLFLFNRLIWILVASGFLLLTYRLFSFRAITKKVKKGPKVEEIWESNSSYIPAIASRNFKAKILAFFSLLKVELRGVFVSLPFIAVLIMWLLIVFSELYSTLISGGEYGVSVYPFTSELIDLIINPMLFFSLILIVFYGAEIVWKERNLNFNLIIDATPVKNHVLFLAKFTALIALPILLISTGVIMCVIFQLALSYTDFDFSLYASVYYHYGVQLLVFCMIALFVNSMVKNKYMGMGIFGMIVLLSLKSNLIGLEHPLTSLGFLPQISYTDMNGFYGGLTKYNHLAMYWICFGLILTLLSFKVWNRGVGSAFIIKIKQLLRNWSKIQRLSIYALFILFIIAGTQVYYNNNIVSEYSTVKDRFDVREQYERKFKKYEYLADAYAGTRKTEVAFYPKERRYTVKADYFISNKGDKAITQVFITERIPLQKVAIKNAVLVMQDSIYGIYLFELSEALQPNDSISYSYELEHELQAYEEDQTIVKNGSYITHRNFEPILGYLEGIEIADKSERAKRKLPPRTKEKISESHIVADNFKQEKIRFETTLSTDADQSAISSGTLLMEWKANDRNFYHFKAKGKILPSVGYFSADYKTKKISYKGIAIEQYYDANHAFNVDAIENSVKVTLDYCIDNFGAYQFDHVRIAELPAHWQFGGFAHAGMISMVSDRLYLADVRDPNSFNLVAKRTIHEVAHQWWAHTLSGKPIAGGSLLVEGLAKYTEGVVMEKMYGKRAIYTLSENARSRYFSGRAVTGEAEPPVYMELGQGYISYGKAFTVLMALRELIGEDQVNKALKLLTDKYRKSPKFEVTSIAFLEEIYKLTPEAHHVLVDDWFKRIITYDLSIEHSTVRKLDDGTFEITGQVTAKRFITTENGEEQQITIDEPIKIGVFTDHPSVVKDDSSILFYEFKHIKDESTTFKLIVDKKPLYVGVDPYGTRSDENYADNTIML